MNMILAWSLLSVRERKQETAGAPLKVTKSTRCFCIQIPGNVTILDSSPKVCTCTLSLNVFKSNGLVQGNWWKPFPAMLEAIQ